MELYTKILLIIFGKFNGYIIKNPQEITFWDKLFNYFYKYFLRIIMLIASYLPTKNLHIISDPIYLMNQYQKKYGSIVNCLDYQYDLILKDLIKHAFYLNLVEKISLNFYKINLNELTKFQVKSGFNLYGGCLYFDHQCKPIKIEYLGKLYRPGYALWEQALFIFRSSLIILYIVYVCTNYFRYYSMIDVLNKLSNNYHLNNHYLMKYLLPISNNKIIKNLPNTVLFGRGRHFDRLFVFTFDGLVKFIIYHINKFSHLTDFEYLNNFTDIDLKELQDMQDLYNVIYSIINQYIENNYEQNDKVLIDFIDMMDKKKYSIKNTPESIINFLINYILVSINLEINMCETIIKYLFNPQIVSTKIQWHYNVKKMCADNQTYQESIILIKILSKIKECKVSNFLYLINNIDQ